METKLNCGCEMKVDLIIYSLHISNIHSIRGLANIYEFLANLFAMAWAIAIW